MSVYFWGLGKNGQLGTGKLETQHTPQHVTRSQDGTDLTQVRQVSCGALFSAIVLNNGQLFTCGCNKYGRLGHGDEKGEKEEDQDDCPCFKHVQISSRVIQVSCGSWHACAITEEGSLYIWGHMKACGNISDGTSTQQKHQTLKYSGIPRPVPFVGVKKILGVACGHSYTFCWTDCGELLSWGRGQHGVLGHGTESDEAEPRVVEEMRGQIVVSVGAGHSHCGIVTGGGSLYMTGKGRDGALGLGVAKVKDAVRPELCDTGQFITSVSCSKGEHHGHTLALTREGNVLTWGDGYKGQLGLGDQNPRHTPTLLSADLFKNERVVCVSAGGIHSTAITCAGNVFTWGCGSDGRLGHPEGQGHRYLFRSDQPRLVEQLTVKRSCDQQISGDSLDRRVCISAAYYHTSCVIGS